MTIHKLRLFDKATGLEIKRNAKVQTFRGEWVTVMDFKLIGGGTGRVYCLDEDGRQNEWFPSVISAVLRVLREDV